MPFSTFQIYLRAFFPHLPLWHWGVLGILMLAVTALILVKKRYSLYGALTIGVAVALALALIDAFVFIRIGGQNSLDTGIDLAAEWRRLTSGDEEIFFLLLFNLAVFVPFGIILEEALAETGKHGAWRRLARVALIAFILSLCIEYLQFALVVGMFEVTDLVLNTTGAVLGGMAAAGIRSLFTKNK
jgi:hypothetical protein